MGHEAFIRWSPRAGNKSLLEASIGVIGEYTAQGYRLTVRQVYYQLVARGIIPNNEKSYDRLDVVLNKGRLAGYIDWDSIEDRARNPVMPAFWQSPAHVMRAAADGYRLDRWQGQSRHVEVWCEKDALSSVIEPVCDRYHVRFLANRGYSSSSAMYDAAQRFNAAIYEDKNPVVIYLGDHDPSGMDMTRDVTDRLGLMTHFGEGAVEVVRLALTHSQVEEYRPPPNPTKLTDSRAAGYIEQFGMESWELDALEPQVLDALISSAIEDHLDMAPYAKMVAREEADKSAIRKAALSLVHGDGDD